MTEEEGEEEEEVGEGVMVVEAGEEEVEEGDGEVVVEAVVGEVGEVAVEPDLVWLRFQIFVETRPT